MLSLITSSHFILDKLFGLFSTTINLAKNKLEQKVPADAKYWPLGLNANACMLPEWPPNTLTRLPSVTDHSRIDLSADPVAK